MLRTCTFAFAMVFGFLFVVAPAYAQDLQVIGLSPDRNTIALLNTSLTVEFDKPVTTSSITLSSFRVFGRWSGPKAGTFAFADGNRRVTFTPGEPFSAGETIRVNLSHDIEATDLTNLRSAGFAFEMLAFAAPSARVFQLIDTMSNRDSGATRLYGASASDLNEDGFLDLTTVNEISADIRVFLNKGDGTGLFNQPFLTPQSIGVQASPNEPADFDNDGHADLCVAATTSGSVWVLLGVGDGTFAPVTGYTTGWIPHGIAVLDVDGDGDMDIANANVGDNNLSLFINDGSGGFGAASFFEGGVNGEYGLAAADMNNDGITDLVVAGRDGEEIVVQLGNGDGTFTAASPAQSSGGETWVVVCGDLNGDGDIDVTTANNFSDNGAVLLGNGDGTLGVPSVMGTGARVVSTDLGDLDGDGDLDWILSSFEGGFWRVYTNDGSGTFTFDQDFTTTTSPSCAVIYDSDNDGDLDLALTDEIADEIRIMTNAAGSTGIDDLPPPSGLRLRTNAPNPFRSGTRIRFNLPRGGAVSFVVFDAAGRRVSTREIDGVPGWQEYAFDGTDDTGRLLPSGVYFYRVTAGVFSLSDRIVIAR